MTDHDLLATFQSQIWAKLDAEGHYREGGVCPYCAGLGFLTLEVPDVYHIAFGKAFICICRRSQSIFGRGATETGVLPGERKNFEDFEGLPHAAEALECAKLMSEGKKLIDQNGIERVGLILAGPAGTGKSTLAEIIYRYRLAAGVAASWIDYTRFLLRIQATYRERYDGPPAIDIIEAEASAPFLVIDDMGAAVLGEKAASASRTEIMFLMFNQRRQLRLPTLVTTNLLIRQLADQFDDRTYSRMRGLCHAVDMVGPDMRIEPPSGSMWR